jgi:hypothetical protein
MYWVLLITHMNGYSVLPSRGFNSSHLPLAHFLTTLRKCFLDARKAQQLPRCETLTRVAPESVSTDYFVPYLNQQNALTKI